MLLSNQRDLRFISLKSHHGAKIINGWKQENAMQTADPMKPIDSWPERAHVCLIQCLNGCH